MADKKLKQKELKRRNIMDSVNRIQEFVANFTEDDAREVPLRLERLEKYFELYETIQSEYEALDDSDAFAEANLSVRAKFEEQYFRLKAALLAIMPRPVQAPEQQPSVVQNTPNNVGGLANVKLPTIKLPEFSGDYNDWLTFHDTFLALIHLSAELSNVQKFHYLRASLRGEAARLTETLTITAANYTVAWKILLDRYSNKYLLKKKHIKAIIEYPRIKKQSSSSLHAILDEFQRHSQILEQLGEPIDQWDSMLVELLSSKLDDLTLMAWEETAAKEDAPTFNMLAEFLQQRTRVLESVSVNQHNQSQLPSNQQQLNKRSGAARIASHTVTERAPERTSMKCCVCDQTHSLSSCTIFGQLPLKDRLEIVNSKALCSNCLRGDHFVRGCKSKFVCRTCKKRHHTILHPGFGNSRPPATETDTETVDSTRGTENGNQTCSVPTLSTNCCSQTTLNAALRNTCVFLSTVLLRIVDCFGVEQEARALLDSCSQANIISEQLCKRLQLRRRNIHVEICGIGNSSRVAKHTVYTTIRSRINGSTRPVHFIVLDKVTMALPPESVSIESWNIPSELSLADPLFNISNEIDMVIGAQHYFSFIRNGRIKLMDNLPLLVDSEFGWLVSGLANMNHAEEALICNSVTLEHLDAKLERFWLAEEISGPARTREEQSCEDFFQETTTRTREGRYVVRLPKREGFDSLLGESKPMAIRRFHCLEAKFAKEPALRAQYNEFMAEYLRLGNMHLIAKAEDDEMVFYLPHHPIMKNDSSTTKMRVVFDGSAKSSTGHSLNDLLQVGPLLQDELLSIIFRFRTFEIALVADIEKMYRQVLVHSDDQPLQRIIYRFDPKEELKTYQLDTVTYGLGPSSFLAVRSLHQLADDYTPTHPETAKVVRKGFYVDDFVYGAQSVEQAVKLREDVTDLLSKGGFRLRKWCSNSKSVLETIPSDLLDTKLQYIFEDDKTVKTLGVVWDVSSDCLRFAINMSNPELLPTKRNILSVIAQIYDPQGIAAPVVAKAKILLQQLWVQGFKWDQVIPAEFQRRWEEFRTISMLHFFLDASNDAYGAVAYIRSWNSVGTVQISLLASKSRVAPLKTKTVPRLELSAAVLSARLYERVKKALEMKFDAVYFHVDSTVVLHWVTSSPHKWKVYVANRISEIQSLTEGHQWLHVSGAENPADLVSRGVTARELVDNPKWKNGPEWLKTPRSMWPKQPTISMDQTTVEEEGKKVALPVRLKTPFFLFTRWSSYRLLLHATAYLMRFTKNSQLKQEEKDERIVEPQITINELEAAKKALVRLLQLECFSIEIDQLRKARCVSKGSPLRLLNPYLDSEGIVRVGGRLRHSQEPFSKRQPIVIPGFHPFTKLLVKHIHQDTFHGGMGLTLAVIRDEFWPLSGRRAVRSVLRECYICFRAKPIPIEQPVGQLPSARVTSSEAFACTGIDYCGPVYVKPPSRKAAPIKAYVAIFICMSSKAVHIELVGDLSTSTFISALRRFMSRRGMPEHIYSDNGRNFVGAANELRKLYEMLQDTTKGGTLSAYLNMKGIQWHLIPPRAPNFGGLWEAAVKIAKRHLIRQLGSSILNYEDLTTVLTQIEGYMNSRPLTALNDDPHDLRPLTPAHLAINRGLQSLPEHDLRDIPANRLNRYQRVLERAQGFWYRWKSEYLLTLNQQAKHNPKATPIQVGRVVILKNDLLPPMQWPLARVLEVHPGSDGITRVVTLRTSSGVLQRAVNNICPLPWDLDRPSEVSASGPASIPDMTMENQRSG